MMVTQRGERRAPRAAARSLLALATLALFGLILGVFAALAEGPDPTARLPEGSGPSIGWSAGHGSVDAAPRRFDPHGKRSRAFVDAWSQGAFVAWSSFATALAPLARQDAESPGYDEPRDVAIARFRRRIPRMSSDEPPGSPCGA